MSPWIHRAPQVSNGEWGSPGKGYFLTWSSFGRRFEHRVDLTEDDSLIVRGAGEGGVDLIVKEGEGLLQTPQGALVMRGRDYAELLPVLANPRLYVGVKLVNSAPHDSSARDETGLIAGTEVRVTGVFPGSPAEAAGLQAGDVLLRVKAGGDLSLKVSSRQTIAKWWFPILAGTSLEFQVRRGEETLTISVKTRNRLPAEFREGSSISDAPDLLERH